MKSLFFYENRKQSQSQTTNDRDWENVVKLNLTEGRNLEGCYVFATFVNPQNLWVAWTLWGPSQWHLLSMAQSVLKERAAEASLSFFENR